MITKRKKTAIKGVNALSIVPTLSNSEQTRVIFFDVILRNDKMSSSTAKNSLKMLNEKFIKISETEIWIFVFPDAFENFMEVSKGSKILMPLLSIVNPSAFAFISTVSPFETSLEAGQPHQILSAPHSNINTVKLLINAGFP